MKKLRNAVVPILSLAVIFGLGEASFFILSEINESILRRALDYMIYNFFAMLFLVLTLSLVWFVATKLLKVITGKKLIGPENELPFLWFEVVLTLLAIHLFFATSSGSMRGLGMSNAVVILVFWAVISTISLFVLKRPAVAKAFRLSMVILTTGALLLSLSIVVYNGIANRAEGPKDIAEGRPNFLLITIDTLRADALSCYGHPEPSTPNIDRLARGGVLFKKAFSPSSWTYPAMASLLTSLPPPAHTINGSSLSIRESYTTIAEVFKANGYYTGSIIGHPVLNSKNGYNQGVIYFDVIDNNIPSKLIVVKRTNLFLLRALNSRPSILERSLIPVLSFECAKSPSS